MQLEMSINIQSPLRRGNLAGTQDIGFERDPPPPPPYSTRIEECNKTKIQLQIAVYS